MKPKSRELYAAAAVCATVPRPAAVLGYALAVERLATGWRNLCDNFAVVRRSLHRQKVAFAATYDVESYAHTVRERLGVAASLLFGHDAGPFLPLTAGYLSNVFFASVGSVRGATTQLASRPRSWLRSHFPFPQVAPSSECPSRPLGKPARPPLVPRRLGSAERLRALHEASLAERVSGGLVAP